MNGSMLYILVYIRDISYNTWYYLHQSQDASNHCASHVLIHVPIVTTVPDHSQTGTVSKRNDDFQTNVSQLGIPS